jgi:hypothetical protein
MRKIVLVEPKSTHLHVYSRVAIPRLGVVLLGTILRNLGYDVQVYIEDIAPVDMREVMGADVVGSGLLHRSTLTPYLRVGRPVPVVWAALTSFMTERTQHADYVIGAREGIAPNCWKPSRAPATGSIQNLPPARRSGDPQPRRPMIRDLDVNPIRFRPGSGRTRASSASPSRLPPCAFCSVPGM